MWNPGWENVEITVIYLFIFHLPPAEKETPLLSPEAQIIFLSTRDIYN